MPLYQILFHGWFSGIEAPDLAVPILSEGGPIHGFYATRRIRARSFGDAADDGRNKIRQELADRGLATDGHILINVDVEESSRVKFASWSRGSLKGFTFYEE
ncbi:MAG TPA: hypothetical protein VF552_01885 [Allosphingosinicella sp.]|jgi:hypothetical protein